MSLKLKEEGAGPINFVLDILDSQRDAPKLKEDIFFDMNER